MPITPLKHKAEDVIIQLGIATHNLKNVPVGDILSCVLIDAEDNQTTGILALIEISQELSRIGMLIAEYAEKRYDKA